MSEHQWCQDVSRDEAVRAAEDAAAVPAIMHRDLPDQVALLWASVTDILGRVVRLEGEMDAGQAEEAAIGSGDVFADLKCGSRADEVVRLTAERDAACAECERLRATVARLERRYLRCVGLRDADGDTIAELKEKCDALRARVAELQAAPAAGGEAKQEPEAWGVKWLRTGRIDCDLVYATRDEAHETATAPGNNGTVVPLYAAPPEPRGWLTAEEEDAVDHAADIIEDMEDDDGSSLKPKADALRALLARPSSEPRGWLTKNERSAVESARDYFAAPEHDDDECAFLAAALCGLLARSSPPRVQVPPIPEQFTLVAWNICVAKWIAAIRAAGGEVAG